VKRRARPGAASSRRDLLPGRLLPLGVAFVSGFTIMMLEILGGRVLAPYFGYSIYQWGALIGVVMGALACGYWVGGRVGDTPRAVPFLAAALASAAVYVMLVPPLSTAVLAPLRGLGPAWGAVAASTVLLALPSALLATVSPIVVRLTATERLADTAGRVYAIGTLGSIAGTFFTAFWAIPVLGTRFSHYVAAALLGAAVAAVGLASRRPRYVAAVAVLVLAAIPAPRPALPGLVFEGESLHNIIQVVDDAQARYLFLNYTDGPQTIMPREGLLSDNYYDFFLLGPLLAGGPRVLFLGAAGGTSLKQLVTAYPDVEVVGVELDGQVIDVARRYFGLADLPRLRLVEDDARWHLERSPSRYDVIAIDLYVTGHVPFFTTTREFFALVRERLTDRGVAMMNILSPGPGQDLIGPFVRTARAVFTDVHLIGEGNIILVASRGPLDAGAVRHTLAAGGAPAVVRRVAERALRTVRPASVGAEWPLFTDDRNDVEFRTFRMFHGGE
jgi:spermidine synthase